MTHSLRRAWRVGISQLPIFTAFCSDGLAVVLTLTALFAGGAISQGQDRPESVVLDFTATWCGPCQEMSPVVHKLQKQGYAIRKVDVDQQQSLARSYGINSIPTFVLIIEGKEVTRVSGKVSEDQLRKMAHQAGQPPVNAPSTKPPKGIPLPETRRDAIADNRPNDDHTFGEQPVGTPKSAAEREKSGGVLGKLFGKPKREVAGRGRPEVLDIRAKDMDEDEVADFGELNPLLAASVRVRVSDDSGSNFGSGTIIDSRVGRTVILTCGHIFRAIRKSNDMIAKSDEPAEESADKTVTPRLLEVDIFLPGGRSVTYVGKLVDADLVGDVGIVTIPTAGVLAATPLAPRDALRTVGDELTSIGCGGGEEPKLQATQLTAINRYDGPDNLECTTAPKQGRSGGGLFDDQGHLVGVCIAADQESDRGLYAGLKPIYALLTRAKLQQVLPPAERPAQPLIDEVADDRVVDVAPVEEAKRSGKAAAAPFGDADLAWLDHGQAPSADELAGMFADAPEAEVICIVRPKNGAADRVVILNQASPKFMTYLLDSADTGRKTATQDVSFRVEDSASGNDSPHVRQSRFGARFAE